MSGGTLLVVATPLGNLGDLSPRAAAALAEASLVFCEDTRVTQTLIGHVGSAARLVSLHAHNEQSRVASVLDALAAGERVVLVSDAGTPLVSDPGERTIAAAAAAGHQVVPVPGPSAVLAALSVAGFPAVPFAFFGFLERARDARQRQLAAMRQFAGTAVVFESKERIAQSLAELAATLGHETLAMVGRELTKRHETFYRGTLAELAVTFAETDVRGELTVVIGPRASEAVGFEPVEAVVAELGADRTRPLAVRVKELVLRTGLSRKDAYRILSNHL